MASELYEIHYAKVSIGERSRSSLGINGQCVTGSARRGCRLESGFLYICHSPFPRPRLKGRPRDRDPGRGCIGKRSRCRGGESTNYSMVARETSNCRRVYNVSRKIPETDTEDAVFIPRPSVIGPIGRKTWVIVVYSSDNSASRRGYTHVTIEGRHRAIDSSPQRARVLCHTGWYMLEERISTRFAWSARLFCLLFCH